jgi:hypothetical protein
VKTLKWAHSCPVDGNGIAFVCTTIENCPKRNCTKHKEEMDQKRKNNADKKKSLVTTSASFELSQMPAEDRMKALNIDLGKARETIDKQRELENQKRNKEAFDISTGSTNNTTSTINTTLTNNSVNLGNTTIRTQSRPLKEILVTAR